ncbi:hypothetical protein M422DRAFT_40106 [Sphaerobolus stellatus SS14]|uniref:Uncharacterized protein n=1 Tax=Sphaerobolus stellatus (strain SS14) TaxID=990650 RepID=A0A0C9U9T5_SPHS4|nr:hypothetical protein M422DRAFT_40106 [Sphaerobolus stellatus SS14]
MNCSAAGKRSEGHHPILNTTFPLIQLANGYKDAISSPTHFRFQVIPPDSTTYRHFGCSL